VRYLSSKERAESAKLIKLQKNIHGISKLRGSIKSYKIGDKSREKDPVESGISSLLI